MERGKKRVVVIGGGTGTFTVLSMADDGGSTGRLRDEFGVLPPGDIRQCLVALSDAGHTMRRLMSHRFDRGTFSGHSFGNILISTLEQITGDLDSALDMLHQVLNIKGRVVPVTLEQISLNAELRNGKILCGESAFMEYQLVSRYGIKRIWIQPKAKANPKALRAIAEADYIVVGPGKLYTSILPNFLVSGVAKAFIRSRAKKVYVANLMSQQGHTDNFSVIDHVTALESYIAPRVFDEILYNTKRPPTALIRRYADEGEPVECKKECRRSGRKLIGTDLLAEGITKSQKKDLLRRTLIRHDPEKLAKVILARLH